MEDSEVHVHVEEEEEEEEGVKEVSNFSSEIHVPGSLESGTAYSIAARCYIDKYATK